MQLPRLSLRIHAIEVSKESGIGQVPETRGVIGHGVVSAGDVEQARDVTEMALMQCAEAKQVRPGAVRGGGPFGAPSYGGRVIAAHFQVGLSNINGTRENIRVRDGSRELQVGAQDVAARVFPRD